MEAAAQEQAVTNIKPEAERKAIKASVVIDLREFKPYPENEWTKSNKFAGEQQKKIWAEWRNSWLEQSKKWPKYPTSIEYYVIISWKDCRKRLRNISIMFHLA